MPLSSPESPPESPPAPPQSRFVLVVRVPACLCLRRVPSCLCPRRVPSCLCSRSSPRLLHRSPSLSPLESQPAPPQSRLSSSEAPLALAAVPAALLACPAAVPTRPCRSSTPTFPRLSLIPARSHPDTCFGPVPTLALADPGFCYDPNPPRRGSNRILAAFSLRRCRSSRGCRPTSPLPTHENPLPGINRRQGVSPCIVRSSGYFLMLGSSRP